MAISVAFVSEIEAVTAAGVFQRCCAVDEKHAIVDVYLIPGVGTLTVPADRDVDLDLSPSTA